MYRKYKIRKFKVSKDHSAENEDKIYLTKSKDFIKVVLLDGASESFDSIKWVQNLSEQFKKSYDFSFDQTKYNILNASRKFLTKCQDKIKLSWSKRASFQRGSFSTLIVFECDKKSGQCRYLCIGDSSIFFIKDYSMIYSVPYSEYSMFSKHPYLISNKIELNSFLDKNNFEENFIGKFNLSENHKYNILLMTDAISAWAMKNSDDNFDRYKKLSSLTSREELRKLVVEERKKGTLKTDDTSVVNISVS